MTGTLTHLDQSLALLFWHTDPRWLITRVRGKLAGRNGQYSSLFQEYLKIKSKMTLTISCSFQPKHGDYCNNNGISLYNALFPPIFMYSISNAKHELMVITWLPIKMLAYFPGRKGKTRGKLCEPRKDSQVKENLCLPNGKHLGRWLQPIIGSSFCRNCDLLRGWFIHCSLLDPWYDTMFSLIWKLKSCWVIHSFNQSVNEQTHQIIKLRIQIKIVKLNFIFMTLSCSWNKN